MKMFDILSQYLPKMTISQVFGEKNLKSIPKSIKLIPDVIKVVTNYTDKKYQPQEHDFGMFWTLHLFAHGPTLFVESFWYFLLHL
jgi:hypothetical protein